MLPSIATHYIAISFVTESLRLDLPQLLKRPMVRIGLKDNPFISYFGFVDRDDMAAAIHFATQRGIPFRKLDLETMSQRLFRPGSYTIDGDVSLVPFLATN